MNIALSNSCTPSSFSCAFYTCMEKEVNCGKDGYLQKYGAQLCKDFLKFETRSEELKTWLTSTRICLQRKLWEKRNAACEDLEDLAITDHLECYFENGYCNLSNSDKREVKSKILLEFLKAPVYVLKNVREFLKHSECL
jgi:hypothetical protein